MTPEVTDASRDLTKQLPPEVKLSIVSFLPEVSDARDRLCRVEGSDEMPNVRGPGGTCRSLSATNRSWRKVSLGYILETINLYWLDDKEHQRRLGPKRLPEELSYFHESTAIPYGHMVKNLVLPIMLTRGPDRIPPKLREQKYNLLAKVIDCFVNLKGLYIVVSGRGVSERVDPLWDPCMNALLRRTPLQYAGVWAENESSIYLGDRDMQSLMETGIFNATRLQLSSTLLQQESNGPLETSFLPSLASTQMLNMIVPRTEKPAALDLPPSCTNLSLFYYALGSGIFATFSATSLQRIKSLFMTGVSYCAYIPPGLKHELSVDDIVWHNLVDLRIEYIKNFGPMSGILRQAPKLRRLLLASAWGERLDMHDLAIILSEEGQFTSPLTSIVICHHPTGNGITHVLREEFESCGEFEYQRVCSRRKIECLHFLGDLSVEVGKEIEKNLYRVIRPSPPKKSNPRLAVREWLGYEDYEYL